MRTGLTIIAAGLAVTLAGATPARQTYTEPQPCAGESSPLPADLLQRCATKALRGDFGKLAGWQEDGYQRALDKGITVQGKAWVTSYYPAEGFYRGKHTASGRGVSERSAAVCQRERHMLLRHYVWTAAYGMRIVEDTGANSNHRVASRKGADRWIDYWFARPHNHNPVTAYAFIEMGPKH